MECVIMNVIDYQIWTRSTAVYPKDRAIEYLALGLTSEAGEVAGKIKKLIRDGTYDESTIVDELGDVLYYLVRFADELGFTMDDIIDRNVQKLSDRKARGVLSGSGDTR
jgi:NTP pyrophosphatase (non-canonical NTP hydrolase)